MELFVAFAVSYLACSTGVVRDGTCADGRQPHKMELRVLTGEQTWTDKQLVNLVEIYRDDELVGGVPIKGLLTQSEAQALMLKLFPPVQFNPLLDLPDDGEVLTPESYDAR
jgi:hypothetical protein